MESIEHIKVILFFLRYADQLSITDEVLVHQNDKLTPDKVINVSSLIMQGDYDYPIVSNILILSLFYFKKHVRTVSITKLLKVNIVN